MIASPARRAPEFELRSDEVRFERAISRMLAPADQSCGPTVVTLRPKAIFRVVLAGLGFEYTRSLIGLPPADAVPSVERFGPFETERAAHALAKRAAARFAAENPKFDVGVVGIEAEVRRELPVSNRFMAQSLTVGQAVETPKCVTCNKPTRYYRGRPQLYCSKSIGSNPCIAAAKTKRANEDPAKKAHLLARLRERHARKVATPEGRAQEREKWRRRHAKLTGREFTPFVDQQLSGVVPTCEVCGKPTGYTNGRALKFCPKKPGEKRSQCNTIYSGRVYLQRQNDDPLVRLAKNQSQLRRRRATPDAWAKHLEESRKRKARRRECIAAQRPAVPLPTGSVLATASPRGEGYDLLARLYTAVPSNMPPALRMEIISETAVLVLEGAEMSVAVAEASKNVRRNGSRLRYAKSIDDCFWLADETQSMPESF